MNEPAPAIPEAHAPAAKTMLRYINTGTQITFVHEGKPYHILRADDKSYAAAVEQIKEGVATGASLLALLDAPRLALLELLAEHKSLTLDGDVLLYRGYPVHPTLSKKLFGCLKDGFGAQPFLKFLENLALNPRREVLENLYEFLEYGKMALDDEGHFYAYKAVAADYTDIRTGTYDNSIGKVVEMPAWAVDPDRNQTCSAGLHCCSFDYLDFYNHADGHVMVVRVNPRDVIAIPADYRNTKMRVCRYEVTDEYKDYYSESRRNVLAEREVIPADMSYDDEVFELEVDFGVVGQERLRLIERYVLEPSADEIAKFIQEAMGVHGSHVDWVSYNLSNISSDTVLLEVVNSRFGGESDGMGNTYYLLGHPESGAFEAFAPEAVLLGTFNAGNRACRALLQMIHEREDVEFKNFAVFSTRDDSCEGLEHAVRMFSTVQN